MGFPIRRGSKSIWLGDIFLSEDTPDLKCLRLRDPDKFIAGGILKLGNMFSKIIQLQKLLLIGSGIK